MALSGAERNRRYREKQKTAGLGDILKENDRKRKQLARSKMSSSQLAVLRLRQQYSLRKFRTKSKLDPVCIPTTSSFKTVQSKAKALKIITNVLPKNKSKQCELVKKVAEDLNLLKIEKKYDRAGQSLQINVKNKIYEFYCRDDISYQAPGKRDTVTIKENGTKTKLQKRFLLYTLREMYQLFIEENPTIQVSRSSFQGLRPCNVLYKSLTPHNVCVCVYHENILLLLKSLNLHVQGLRSVDLHSFIKILVCEDNNEFCMFNNCSKCVNNFKNKIENKIIDSKSIIKWTLWSTSPEGRAVKIDYEGSVVECVNVLSNKIKDFLFHTFVKRQQSQFFEMSKTNVTDKRCLLQVDYSENYSIVEQNEIQSAHCSKKQLSIFTAHFWAQSTTQSMVLVSDDISHNKYTVSKCIEHIINRLQLLVPSLDELIIFSDGSASQFKQRFLFKNLSYLAKKFDVILSWHFFATSHGKG
ncbi:unnamed protein product [Rotaria magnacalcarata]|uniref:Uncharacterized protein n=1 Tax=Rotaria magnacalcarata TaxID=392030 RepID=A0A820JZV7_9BILA|nr:unnamed protein product [Rotaria magnacalcarata]CAF4332284.1 unnamed protein product [Rotaria magnacalcarata]